ncbi:MAG: AAA family ATPase, partial [Myxococcota bacterium]|nr:AAA family ATPase [Myxococcota bacterium]
FNDVKSPVGSVGEVLFKLMQSEGSSSERIAVMEGSLSEFDLMSVLQVVSIGRQFSSVDVLESSGRPLGKIEIKAGKVVSAHSNHLHGVDAILRLLRSPPDTRFVVHRLTAPVGDQHIGSLVQIMMKLGDLDLQWDAAEPSTEARRPPTASVLAAEPVRAKETREPSEDSRAAAFVPTCTSPFGLSTLPLPTGDVPVVCVTSPKGGAGKTTIALNLGVAFARQGKRCMLVDADYDGLLLALNAKGKTAGAFDVVADKSSLADATLKTRMAGLRIAQSGDPSSATASSPAGWTRLFKGARADSDIVLVDTSAGIHGPSADACAAATHVLVVIPAEPAAIRALPAHLRRLESLGSHPPKVVGVVLNMLDYRAHVSLDVLRDLCASPSAPWVFDIPIARSMAFMEAVARGVPVCGGDRTRTPTIGWVFEMLASGILDRLGIGTPPLAEPPLI